MIMKDAIGISHRDFYRLEVTLNAACDAFVIRNSVYGVITGPIENRKTIDAMLNEIYQMRYI